MNHKQDFLILDRGQGMVVVYRPSTYPVGKVVIGPGSRRLRVVAPSRVELPGEVISEAELERWRADLTEAGNEVTIAPIPEPSRFDLAEARERSIPLKEAFDELLRQADARADAEDRRTGPVVSRHP